MVARSVDPLLRENERMTVTPAQPSVPDLPSGWAAREPDERDIPRLAKNAARVTRAATGRGTADVFPVISAVTGTGAWTRRQQVVLDPGGVVRAWFVAHDRAAGRTLVEITVDPEVPQEEADAIAAAGFAWTQRSGRDILRLRRVETGHLDSGCYADDARQRRWLEDAGYHCTRSWLQMSRPVTPDEAQPGVLPAPREGVVVRRVQLRGNGLPTARDVQAVHQVLEESFADHFNSYRESFPEFVHRLQEDPGHTWDHWWLALVQVDGDWHVGGAVVSTVLPPDADGEVGSYVDYIGVHRRARGRGVAKALLHTVIRDAAERGRNRVGLEVDADSPTGADGLYRSLGWETAYVTQSWHKGLSVAGAER